MGLDSVELTMEVEESFGIILPDGELSEIVTVGDFVAIAWSKVESGGELSEDEVRGRVHQIVCDFFAIESCQDGDRFIEDLGMG